jgi:hypothetical protein
MKRIIVFAILAAIFLLIPLFAAEKTKPAADSSLTIDRSLIIDEWKKQAQDLDEKFYKSLTPEQRNLLDTQKQLIAQIRIFSQLADSTLRVKK